MGPLTPSLATKICTTLALLGMLTGGLAAWTLQSIRYGAALAIKDTELANKDKIIAEMREQMAATASDELTKILENNRAADVKYAQRFNELQKAIRDAKLSVKTSPSEPRRLTPDELCILRQAERIAQGRDLSPGCGETSIAVSSGKYDKD